MADTIYMADGSVEYIFDANDEPAVLENIIRRKLGADMADRFKAYTEPYARSEDELTDALRDLADELTNLQDLLENSQRISRKGIEHIANRMQRIINNNL
jgi:hypothetical protein